MFLSVLEKLMNEHNLNVNQLSKKSGIPYMTLKNFWEKGCSNIKLSTLRQLADYFNVSLDFLVMGENKHLSIIEDLYNKLNTVGKKKAEEHLRDLLKIDTYINKEINEGLEISTGAKKTTRRTPTLKEAMEIQKPRPIRSDRLDDDGYERIAAYGRGVRERKKRK